jgi:hypothetical protein
MPISYPPELFTALSKTVVHATTPQVGKGNYLSDALSYANFSSMQYELSNKRGKAYRMFRRQNDHESHRPPYLEFLVTQYFFGSTTH